MRTRRILALLVGSAGVPFLAGTGCAPADLSGPASLDEKVVLGSRPSIVQRMRGEDPQASRRYQFPIGAGSDVAVLVQAYDEEDGRLSMSGRAVESENTEFILKVNQDDIYGWIVDRDQGAAWEITADNDGDVVVEGVPVEKIFPVCPVPSDDGAEPTTLDEPSVLFNAPMGFPGHVGMYADTDVTKLQSRPGSQKVWYINLTDVMNGTEPKSGHTKADVWVSWSIAAANLYPFDVNVTTDPAVYAAAGATNSGCTTMIYADIGGTSSCALNIFGTRRCCDNHLYRDGYGTGRILNHEAGHGWGLGHDGGNPGGEYYEGIPDFQWTPLMGNVWPADRWQQALIQLSKGEYSSATQTQDDFAILDRTLDFVPDDIADAKPLVLDATTVTATKNWGQIGRNTDTDSWSFEIGPGGGNATLRIDRIEHRGGSMLDVDASIVNSMGASVAQANAMASRNAELTTDLPAGRYTVVVKGGAEGTPQRGFSNYSSVGLYAISGTIMGGVSVGGMGGMAGAGGMGGASGNAGAGGLGGVGGFGGAGEAGAGSGSGGALGGGAGQAGTPGASGLGGGGGNALGGAAGSAVAGMGANATSGSAGLSAGGTGNTGLGGTGAVTGGDGAAGVDDESGCGCRVAGSRSRRDWGALLVAGLGLVFVRRRRANAVV